MSFNYQVILKPKDVKFSVKEIPSKFNNGNYLKDVYNDILSGKVLCKDIPAAEVVWDSDRWEWYTLNNRRLWVFKELEKSNKITYIGMSRVEVVENDDYQTAPKLYSYVDLYDPQWDISILEESNCNGKKIMSTELHSLSKCKETKINDKDQGQILISSDDGDDDQWVEKSQIFSDKKILSTVHKVGDLSTEKISSYHYRSNQSLFSNVSCSSISRNERVINESSGLSGYGNYHTYKTEYLDKIRSGKKKLLERYKPYNVSSLNGRLSRSLSYSCEISEKITKRDRRYSHSSTSSDVRNECHDVMKSLERKTRRIRLYSDDIDSESNYSSRKNGNESSVVPYKRSLSDCSNYNSGISLAELYAMWQKRRTQYIQSSHRAITNGSVNGYLCGLCFKNFKRIVDLQQHSEALLHYACITCGKFFSSYASLGQHCERLRHKKD